MRLLAITDLRGATERMEQVTRLVQEHGINAIVFSGNIIGEDVRTEAFRRAATKEEAPEMDIATLRALEDAAGAAYEEFFYKIGKLGVPVFVVPGYLDAPKRLYLQAALNHEIVQPNVYMVHQSFALPLQGQNLVVAGFGGGISDDYREDRFVHVYPAWEAEFALDYLRNFEQELILVFHTPPVKGTLGKEGSANVGHSMIDHLIKTYRPVLAFCGNSRDGQGTAEIGTTLVIHPGLLQEGKYAIVDTRTKDVSFGQLPALESKELVR
jgi:Icc-related predicted phosphoesterase